MRKWDYNEVECEVLRKYLQHSDLMKLSVIVVQEEATIENPKPEEVKHNAMVVKTAMRDVGEADLKMLELELNIFELSDACKEMEEFKKKMEE